jgi:hypothetical protein
MDIQMIKSLPKQATKLVKTPPKTLGVYLGFLLLVSLLSYLSIPNYIKVISLFLGTFLLVDILHFMKSRYVNGTK